MVEPCTAQRFGNDLVEYLGQRQNRLCSNRVPRHQVVDSHSASDRVGDHVLIVLKRTGRDCRSSLPIKAGMEKDEWLYGSMVKWC